MDANTMKCITITQYHEKMGTFCLPDGFEAHLKKLVYEYDRDFAARTENGMLRGEMKRARVKSIVKQMRCYGWSEQRRLVEWNDPRLVAEAPDPELQKMIHPVMPSNGPLRLIVHKDMVVGVVFEEAVDYYLSGEDYFYVGEDTCIFPDHGYVCASTSDNNGAGYKNRDWYRYLICLPYNHNLW